MCGDSQLLDTSDDIVAFVRRTSEGSVLCAFNLGYETVEWTPPEAFRSGTVIADEMTVNGGGAVPTQMGSRTGYWAVEGDS